MCDPFKTERKQRKKKTMTKGNWPQQVTPTNQDEEKDDHDPSLALTTLANQEEDDNDHLQTMKKKEKHDQGKFNP
jgi:hypothetical protein